MQFLVRIKLGHPHIYSHLKWHKSHTGVSHQVHIVLQHIEGGLPYLNLRHFVWCTPDY